MPDSPVFVVEVEESGKPPLFLWSAEIFDLSGRLMLVLPNRPQAVIEADCREFADVEIANLHFHYTKGGAS